MLRAISLGVFCLWAPSTSAIMRSRKVSPGLEVILDHDPVGKHLGSTRYCGAVTARFAVTGADSPVMADSSTEATPSMTSPSPAI